MRKIIALVIMILLPLVAGCGGGGGPKSDAGIAQSVPRGAVVTLDGGSSSNALTYSWSFSSKPDGSSAVLSSPTAVKPTFTADVAGVYVIKLVVTDGSLISDPVTVTVTAYPITAVFKLSASGTLPTGKAVSGFGATIELPAGITVKTTPEGAVDPTVVVPSGLLGGAGQATMGPVTYTADTGASKATLKLAIASNALAGVGVGEYATITFVLTDASPKIEDLKIIGFEPVDLSFAPLTTLTANKTVTLY